jgi:hypothetical protein
MADSSHDTGWYNVQGTLAAWLTENLTTYKPALVATVIVTYDAPESPLSLPQWSVHFLGVVPTSDRYQGSYVGSGEYGQRKAGMMEVNCWASRNDDNWRAQLAQMADAVYRAVFAALENGGAVIIKDFYTSASAPADTGARLVIEGAEERTPPTDPNPDIERVRIIIEFNWVERA